MNDIDCGYILKISPYQEHDGFLTCLLKEHGITNFILKGVFKEKSKLISKTQYFTLYEFRFNYSKSKLNKLIEITTLKMHNHCIIDQQKGLYGQVINGCFYKNHETNLFNLYNQCIIHLNETRNSKLITCFSICKLLEVLGLKAQVDETVDSHNSLVNDFSIAQGGFVEFSQSSGLYSKSQLKLIRYLFKLNFDQIDAIEDEVIDDIVLKTIVEFYEFHTGSKISGKELIFMI